ncbi:MAG: hypothetical protein CMC62_00085 [Flavobacteriaceae bacterium]|nr:hypothetical protein [Flavobacteriaceae bacterium]
MLKNIIQFLKKEKQTLSVAESITGGNLSSSFISESGASSFFLGSVVTYSKNSKIEILNISSEDLQNNSLVSEYISKNMAESCKKLFKSTYSISTTGNAGPKTNDSVSNVGQVFISVASKSGIFTEEFNFEGNRKEIIEQTVENAHRILYKNLIK